jgi:hypothetical protein
MATETYSRIPCNQAECFDDGESIGPHYHSTDANSNNFVMRVDAKGNFT